MHTKTHTQRSKRTDRAKCRFPNELSMATSLSYTLSTSQTPNSNNRITLQLNRERGWWRQGSAYYQSEWSKRWNWAPWLTYWGQPAAYFKFTFSFLLLLWNLSHFFTQWSVGTFMHTTDSCMHHSMQKMICSLRPSFSGWWQKHQWGVFKVHRLH